MAGAPDIATCMYYTGIDPFTKKPVHTAKNLRDSTLPRALMQFFKPENFFEVREALTQTSSSRATGAATGEEPRLPAGTQDTDATA